MFVSEDVSFMQFANREVTQCALLFTVTDKLLQVALLQTHTHTHTHTQKSQPLQSCVLIESVQSACCAERYD